MTDMELLKLAAKAAGMDYLVWTPGAAPIVPGWHRVGDRMAWHPLSDDGDALRLAVKLRLQVTPGTYNKDEFGAFSAEAETYEYWSSLQDENAATRRAIVRAAAEIGKAMP